MSEPTPSYKWENVSVRVDRWRRLQALCEEIEPHQHYDGQNECQVCDEPLTDTLVRHLETLSAQRTALTPAQSGRGEPASPLLPGLERAAESIERRKAEWAALDAVIQTYSDDYEYGEEGYTPSRIELAICYDFLQGLIANDDFLAAIAQVYPVRSTFTAAISRLKGEGRGS